MGLNDDLSIFFFSRLAPFLESCTLMLKFPIWHRKQPPRGFLGCPAVPGHALTFISSTHAGSSFILYPCSIRRWLRRFAHGFLSDITINGQTYIGNNPYGNNDPSVIRKVDSQDPNYGASNPALTCGPDELPASQVADVNPGDSMTFSWKGEDLSDVSQFGFTGVGSTLKTTSGHIIRVQC